MTHATTLKSVVLSHPRSLFVRLSVTCLLSAAFTLQLGYSEAGSILAHSPKSKVTLPSDPKPANPMPVAYRSFAIKGAEGKKSLSKSVIIVVHLHRRKREGTLLMLASDWPGKTEIDEADR